MMGRSEQKGRSRFGKRLQFETLERREVLSASPLLGEALSPADEYVVQGASTQPTSSPIQSLLYWQFNQLAPGEIPFLTLQQIASIPAPHWLEQIPAASRAALSQAQIQALNPSALGASLLTPQQIEWLTVSQIQSLKVADYSTLSPAQVKHLTPYQLSQIPGPGPLSLWTDAAVAALEPAQVQALRVDLVRINRLTPAQVDWLSVAQVQSLKQYDFQYVTPSQAPHLTPQQISTIPDPGPFTQWYAASRAALTAPQIQALNVASVRLGQLTSQQISWLTTAQIQSLDFFEFRYLASEQIPSLTAAQVASIPDPGPMSMWSPAARAALSFNQVRALNVQKVGLYLLTSQQVGWLSVGQIQSLNVEHFRYLQPGQVPSLSIAQIYAIPDANVFWSWTPAARAALTSAQVQAIRPTAVNAAQLTTQQIAWLTAAQIQRLSHPDFKYLTAGQTPFLTPAQILTIPNVGSFSAWSESARAALTPQQVVWLVVSRVRIDLLTPQQVTWLSAGQIRALDFFEFKYLSPNQIPVLTPAQIATIPDPGPFTQWTDEARAALTTAQVQALNVAKVRLHLLTLQQVSWLTPTQIRSLDLFEFKYLQPAQIQWLTPAQIATMQDPAPFAAMSPAARAALTIPQLQALQVGGVGLSLLTTDQITALTISQVRSLQYFDFHLLSQEQIPFLTQAQMASLPDYYVLRSWSDEQIAALSRAQLLSMPHSVWALMSSHSVSVFPPKNYHAVEDMAVGPDGLLTSGHMVQEAERAFDLVPVAEATHATIRSGNWSDPSVWRNGQLPTAGAKVLISANTTVRFDQMMSTAIKTLRIDGTLEFATDRNTQMLVDTIAVYTTGALHIGTVWNPIADHVTANIIIPDSGPIDTTWDPYLQSRGLISRGEIRMYGKSVTPYVSLGIAPRAGATVLYLDQVPKNWKVGDQIVLSGTVSFAQDFHTEQLTIRAINGTAVTVDPLKYNHLPPSGHNLKVYASNLTRNIVFAAVDSSVPLERPHMQFMHNTNIEISNIAVHGFGRTDKTKPINSPVVQNGVIVPGTGLNPRARYAMHFHHLGVSQDYAPARITGNVIVGSPGWGFVNHSSYVVMEHNVAYNVVGSAFATEDGNEIGAMRYNMAINSTGSGDLILARQENHDWGHGGHGFWFQGPGIEVTDNIAVGSRDAAFFYFTASSKNLFDTVNIDDSYSGGGQKAVPVGSIPLKPFSRNTAIASKSGLEIWHHLALMPDGGTSIDNFTSWSTRVAGIDLHYVGHTTINNARLIGDQSYYGGVGIMTNRLTHDLTINNPYIEAFEVGIDVPVRRDTVINGGYIAAVQGLYFEKSYDSMRNATVLGPLTIATLIPAQLRGRQQYKYYAAATIDFNYFVDRKIESLFTPDYVRIAIQGQPPVQLYYYEQSPSYIPFPASAQGYVPDWWLNKTNQQLYNEFGIVFGGGLLPAGAFQQAGVHGFVR